MPNLQRIIALFVFSLIAVAVTACGSSEMAEDDGISKVTPTDTTYAIDDLIAMGFKMNKTYDVEGLTEATGDSGDSGRMTDRSSRCVFIRHIQMRSSLERRSLMNAPAQMQS